MPRVKKPTALKRLEGNPGKRPLNDQEPEPSIGVGDPPDWLPECGKAHWREYAPKLERVRVLTEVDRPIFAQMCQIWADLRAVQAQLAENERIWVKESSGYSQITGYASDEKSLRAEYVQLAKQFGMTASSRAGIKVADPADTNANDPLQLTA